MPNVPSEIVEKHPFSTILPQLLLPAAAALAWLLLPKKHLPAGNHHAPAAVAVAVAAAAAVVLLLLLGHNLYALARSPLHRPGSADIRYALGLILLLTLRFAFMVSAQFCTILHDSAIFKIVNVQNVQNLLPVWILCGWCLSTKDQACIRAIRKLVAQHGPRGHDTRKTGQDLWRHHKALDP